jgi:transcriptional regulator with XRE-family HTH domain
MEGNQLKAILEERGIKQTWVAEKLGIKKSQVNQWVKGVNPIPDKYKPELRHYLLKSA